MSTSPRTSIRSSRPSRSRLRNPAPTCALIPSRQSVPDAAGGATLQQILNTTNPAAIFNAFRFNNDLGTRSEDHIRETWRVVVGAGGDISTKRFNLRYEVALNCGRTETFYDTQFKGRAGNVHVARYNNATNVVLNAAGNIVCAINNDAITTNDDPACVPLNPFGYGAPRRRRSTM